MSTELLVAVTHLFAGALVGLGFIVEPDADFIVNILRIVLIIVLVGTAFLLIARDSDNKRR